MLIVPIVDLPSQVVTVQIEGQNCQLAIGRKATGLFCDIYLNNALIIGGVICENLNRIMRSLWLGFTGDFIFVDTLGAEDPTTPGLGTRWQLVYLSPEDLGGLG